MVLGIDEAFTESRKDQVDRHHHWIPTALVDALPWRGISCSDCLQHLTLIGLPK